MKLTSTSKRRLAAVHPDLQKVINRAVEITKQDFQVSEGLRSKARQRELIRRGASKTMRSRHLTGHAVDLVAMIGGRISWEVPLYYVIADAVKQAAKDVSVPIEWGGDWRSFFDGPHFQLRRHEYPAYVGAGGRVAQKRAHWLIRPGDRGDAVRRLQEKLGGIPDDGIFGPVTRKAVVKFQKLHGLIPNGIVDYKTRNALRL